MTEVEAASGNLAILQYGGGTNDGAVYQMNTGDNDVDIGNTTTAIDAYVRKEYNLGGHILSLRELLLTMKVQSAGDCTVTPMTGGKDRVYEVIAAESGTLTAMVGYDASGSINICATHTLIDPGCWDYVLWAVGPNQCAGGTQIDCSDQVFMPEVISFPVEKASSYFVIVDGFAQYPGNFGPYNLRLELTSP